MDAAKATKADYYMTYAEIAEVLGITPRQAKHEVDKALLKAKELRFKREMKKQDYLD